MTAEVNTINGLILNSEVLTNKILISIAYN